MSRIKRRILLLELSHYYYNSEIKHTQVLSTTQIQSSTEAKREIQQNIIERYNNKTRNRKHESKCNPQA
jgi:hypothetical protein